MDAALGLIIFLCCVAAFFTIWCSTRASKHSAVMSMFYFFFSIPFCIVGTCFYWANECPVGQLDPVANLYRMGISAGIGYTLMIHFVVNMIYYCCCERHRQINTLDQLYTVFILRHYHFLLAAIASFCLLYTAAFVNDFCFAAFFASPIMSMIVFMTMHCPFSLAAITSYVSTGVPFNKK